MRHGTAFLKYRNTVPLNMLMQLYVHLGLHHLFHFQLFLQEIEKNKKTFCRSESNFRRPQLSILIYRGTNNFLIKLLSQIANNKFKGGN